MHCAGDEGGPTYWGATLKVVPVPPLYVKMYLLFCRQVKVIPERHIFAPENILLLCTQKIQLMVLTLARLSQTLMRGAQTISDEPFDLSRGENYCFIVLCFHFTSNKIVLCVVAIKFYPPTQD